jgi:hypothetical protein
MAFGDFVKKSPPWVYDDDVEEADANRWENGIFDNQTEIQNIKKYVVTTGSANTYVATFTLALTDYASGLTLKLKFNVENTASSTINVDTLGEKTIKKVSGTGLVNLEAGDIVANGVYVLVYDGTDFIIVNQFKTKPKIQVFTSSGTFTAPFTGDFKVTVVGGGGSGGSGSPTTTGGGSGGASIKIVTLTKSDAVTVTVGASGGSVVANNTGNAGGTSSFGAFCSATGGIGGNFATSQVYTNGGAGGIGIGGDINLVGNQADFVQGNTGTANGYGASSILGSNYGNGGAGGTSSSGSGFNGVVIVEWMEG